MTENELLEELTNELSLEPLQAGEVTSTMLVESTGLSYSAAHAKLESLVKQGKISYRWAKGNAGRIKAYKKI